MWELALLFLVIILSLIYTYTNGFQDGSSVAASAIGCRALSPQQAIVLVAVMELLGALLGGSAVANTIGSITSWPHRPDILAIAISGLSAAILWNYLMRLLDLPSSSTHALVGGILGAVISASGNLKYVVWGNFNSLFQSTGVCRIVLALVISPLAGFLGGYLLLSGSKFLLCRASTRINHPIKLLQWLTVSALAFGHGSNDTQKAMGIVLLCLNALHLTNTNQVPFWLRLITGLAMAAGIISLVPGIVRKVGCGIYRLRPLHGLITQVSSAGILLGASFSGGPVSATQVISGSVMGAGTADRIKGVRWLIAKDMLVAWFLTIPGSAALSGSIYVLLGHSLRQLL